MGIARFWFNLFTSFTYSGQNNFRLYLESPENFFKIHFRYPRRWWEYPKTAATDYNRPNTGSFI